MVFVERNPDNQIVALYAMSQPGFAEEELADDHPDVVAFRNGEGGQSRPTVAKSTVQARIIEKGKMDEAYLALTSNTAYFARWFAPDRPVVYCDDPDAILLVTAIGLDPTVILAP